MAGAHNVQSAENALANGRLAFLLERNYNSIFFETLNVRNKDGTITIVNEYKPFDAA